MPVTEVLESRLCGDFTGAVDVDAGCVFAAASDLGGRVSVPVGGGEGDAVGKGWWRCS
jgi:hypothetical protein